MADKEQKNLYLNDAQFYDLDNRKVTQVDVSFYHRHAAQANGEILELACGTGRITIPLALEGFRMWGLEYSETMLRQFKNKISGLPAETANRINPVHGDMSNFSLGRTFSSILLPCRSFQLLLDEELELACLKRVKEHLADDGVFIIDVGNFIGTPEKALNWVSDERVFDWENTDPRTGAHVYRTHVRKEIDMERQIIYPHKYYKVTQKDGSVETIVKRSPWKYFFEDQIRELIKCSGYEIIMEMGAYDGRPISNQSPEFIFICKKKA